MSKKSCQDCLYRDFPDNSGFCPHPDIRKSKGYCVHWEWRYE